MTIIRLSNGSDALVKLSVEETMSALRAEVDKTTGFVELPGEEGPIYVRPEGVIALFADSRRSTAGFRIGISGAAG